MKSSIGSDPLSREGIKKQQFVIMQKRLTSLERFALPSPILLLFLTISLLVYQLGSDKLCIVSSIQTPK